MIKTATFAWAGKSQFIRLWDAQMWMGSVNHAIKHFDEVILFSPNGTRSMLMDGLKLPFTGWREINVDPELVHIYEIPKLLATKAMADAGTPSLFIDHDAFVTRGISSIQSAATTSEYRYNPKRWHYDLHEEMPEKRMPKIVSGVCTGLIGGNDMNQLGTWAERSLKCVYSERNRKWMMQADGYQVATIVGECAAGTELTGMKPLIEEVNGESYAKAGFIHIAGGKKDKGLLALMMEWARLAFPDEYIRTYERWNKIWA